MLPDDLLLRVRHEAQRRGTSVAEVVRGAVEREVAAQPTRRELPFFGIGASGQSDGAERAEEILGEIFEERHKSRRDAAG